jgi:hypothetical protein
LNYPTRTDFFKQRFANQPRAGEREATIPAIQTRGITRGVVEGNQERDGRVKAYPERDSVSRGTPIAIQTAATDPRFDSALKNCVFDKFLCPKQYAPVNDDRPEKALAIHCRQRHAP